MSSYFFAVVVVVVLEQFFFNRHSRHLLNFIVSVFIAMFLFLYFFLFQCHVRCGTNMCVLKIMLKRLRGLLICIYISIIFYFYDSKKFIAIFVVLYQYVKRIIIPKKMDGWFSELIP